VQPAGQCSDSVLPLLSTAQGSLHAEASHECEKTYSSIQAGVRHDTQQAGTNKRNDRLAAMVLVTADTFCRPPLHGDYCKGASQPNHSIQLVFSHATTTSTEAFPQPARLWSLDQSQRFASVKSLLSSATEEVHAIAMFCIMMHVNPRFSSLTRLDHLLWGETPFSVPFCLECRIFPARCNRKPLSARSVL
jgi:hypothetical protein